MVVVPLIYVTLRGVSGYQRREVGMYWTPLSKSKVLYFSDSRCFGLRMHEGVSSYSVRFIHRFKCTGLKDMLFFYG